MKMALPGNIEQGLRLVSCERVAQVAAGFVLLLASVREHASVQSKLSHLGGLRDKDWSGAMNLGSSDGDRVQFRVV